MIPVPRPVKRPWMACAYCRCGFMRVASSTNQARRWRAACVGVLAVARELVRRGQRGHNQAEPDHGAPVLHEVIGIGHAVALDVGPSGLAGSGHQ